MGKVLVVEDDADIVDLVGIFLSKYGFTVEKVTRGKDTLMQANMFLPDIILLDINMADCDGKEICKRLKSGASPFKNIPVILFSAACDLEEQTAACGADDFIQKPFDIVTLVNKIKQYTTVATA